MIAPPAHSPHPAAAQTVHPARICIVGGGFGGLYTALYLQKYPHLRDCEMTLVEPEDQFLFTPLLYEVLTDELQVWEVAPTYTSLIAGKNIHWKQDRAVNISLEQRRVSLARGEQLEYDYLVLAAGAVTRSLGIPGVEDHALSFRTLGDALTLKARLAQIAATTAHPSVTVVGGGPSGVELAAKVADWFNGRAQVVLIDRGDTILKPFPRGLRRAAQQALAHRRVEIWPQATVDEVTISQVVGDRGGQPFVRDSDLTIWAIGTQPVGWLGSEEVPSNDRGQVWVRPTLQLLNHPEVFVLGDSAAVKGVDSPAPNTAQAAYQAADTVASSLARLVQGKEAKVFSYLHLGDMLTLGRGAGGVGSFGITLSGRLGGLIRRAVYIHRMPTNRHRLKVARRAIAQLLGLGQRQQAIS